MMPKHKMPLLNKNKIYNIFIEIIMKRIIYNYN